VHPLPIDECFNLPLDDVELERWVEQRDLGQSRAQPDPAMVRLALRISRQREGLPSFGYPAGLQGPISPTVFPLERDRRVPHQGLSNERLNEKKREHNHLLEQAAPPGL